MPEPSHLRTAAAGALAATAWGLLEPIDVRLFRSGYSDIALLGKLVTRGSGWRAAGFALHGANGVVFGLLFGALLRRTRAEPVRLGIAAALAENVVLYPLAYLVDRSHPARGHRDLPPLLSVRVFAQETFRHAVFGLVLGILVRTARSGDGAGGPGRRT